MKRGMLYNEILGDIFNRIEMKSDKPLPMESISRINQFMRVVKRIESEGGIDNPSTFATGLFQLTPDTVDTTMRRFDQDGYSIANRGMLDSDPMSVVGIPTRDQAAIALKNIGDSRGSDKRIERVMRGEGGTDAMVDLYIRDHHKVLKNPTAKQQTELNKAKDRARKIFNEQLFAHNEF